MEEESLEIRKGKIISFFKRNQNYVYIILLLIIMYFSFQIRIQPLPNLQYKYLIDPDAHLFLRYAQQIENGNLPEIDTFRYYPIGFETRKETVFVSYFSVALHKFLKIFSPSLTLELTHIMYPAITFIFALLFFFLLARKLFNNKVAILATAFLAFLPPFLFRTLSGVSDKEALSIPFIFAAFYFYICALKNQQVKKWIILTILSAISTLLALLSWGGGSLIILIIPSFMLVFSVLDKIKKREMYIYSVWYILVLLLLLTVARQRYDFKGIFIALNFIAANVTFIFLLIDHFITKKNIIKIRALQKLPPVVSTAILTGILGIIIISVVVGPLYIINQIKNSASYIINPFGTSRWGLTVAESHQPFLRDWTGDFGRTLFNTVSIFYLILIGSLLIFYDALTSKKEKIILTVGYALFIVAILFNRYASDSVLNGTSVLARVIYIGALIIFPLFVLYRFYKEYHTNRETFDEMTAMHRSHIFVIIWFVFMAMAARGAIRLVFVFVPVAAITLSYLLVKIYDYGLAQKKVIFKYAIVAGIALITLTTVNTFYTNTYNQAKFAGPIFDPQWQAAAGWVEQNTKPSDVFVHWWDYGYLVQTGFKRATVTDGGNAAGSWNYFVGRHILTAQNETEALEFMYPHNVSYLLAVSDEIGKYPAFSSIGSDEQYDRYSFIPTFALDESQTQETRNQTLLLYRGGAPLDEDFIYQGKLFPRGGAGIGGFIVPFSREENLTVVNQPTALVVYNNQRFDIPLSCIFLDDKEITFNSENALPGCLRIIPYFKDNQNYNPIGSSLYLSRKVRNGLFAKLYIYNQETEHIKLSYQTENFPLAQFGGRIIGPLKIWKVDYPSTIQFKKEFLSTEFPNINVTIPNPQYQ